MWKIIDSLYRHTESCVRVGSHYSDWFEVKMGVKQGCVLSPLIFSLFIDGVVEALRKADVGVNIGNVHVDLLLYADDICIVCESEKDLQKAMLIVQKYMNQWRLRVNLTKTKVVVYGRKVKKCEIRYDGVLLDVEESYEYLGLWMRRVWRGRWKQTKDKLIKKTRRKMEMAIGFGMYEGKIRPKTGCKIWKQLIRPVLEYGAEIWGDVEWEEAEKLQREMARRILRCSSSTAKEVVLGELGWMTIKARRMKLMVKYWGKIVRMNEDRLVKRLYREGRISMVKGGWCERVENIMLLLGTELSNRWNTEDLSGSFFGGDFDSNVGFVIQRWEEIQYKNAISRKPKLELYGKIQPFKMFCVKPYLNSMTYYNVNRMMTSFRSGSCDLMIERGRYSKLPREWRLCPMCYQCCEDVQHVLLECEAYLFERNVMKRKFNANEGRELSVKIWDGSRSVYCDYAVEYMLGWYKLFDEEEDVDRRLNITKEFLNAVLKKRKRILDI